MHSAFGLKHIIILIICLILIVVLSIFSRKMSFKNVCKTLFYIGIVSELVKVFTYILINEDKFGGYLPKTDLPFHLCSIQIIFIAIVNITNSDKLKRFILSFMFPSCLIGGFAALVIATSSSLNVWPITFQYNLYHIAIIVFAINMIGNKEIKFEIKDYFNCLKFLLIVMFFAIYINSMLYDGESNINFMYVVKPPMDGLPYLNDNHGWLSYVLKYMLLILVSITICYIRPIIVAIQCKIKSKKA